MENNPSGWGTMTTRLVAGKSPVGSTPPLSLPGPFSSPLGLVGAWSGVGFFSFSLRTAKFKKMKSSLSSERASLA